MIEGGSINIELRKKIFYIAAVCTASVLFYYFFIVLGSLGLFFMVTPSCIIFLWLYIVFARYTSKANKLNLRLGLLLIVLLIISYIIGISIEFLETV